MKAFFLVVFFVISAATVLIAIQTKQLLNLHIQLPQQSEAMQSSQTAKTASLFFSPDTVTYFSLIPQQTDLMIDSGTTPVSSTQIELKFNPSIISFVRLSLPDQSFFGTRQDYTVLFNDVNMTRGRISLALRANSNTNLPQGTGLLAHVIFYPKFASSSIISFTPATFVTSPTSHESILAQTRPLSFTFSSTVSTSSAQISQIENK